MGRMPDEGIISFSKKSVLVAKFSQNQVEAVWSLPPGSFVSDGLGIGTGQSESTMWNVDANNLK